MDLDPRLRIKEHEEVYRPAEDSYLLLDAVDLRDADSFLDVGTGTGILALHAARRCRVVATDINPHAVRLCRRNAMLNGLRVDVVRADLLAGLRGPFDIVAFNPPYLPLDPGGWADRAWSGGREDDTIIRFLDQVQDRLSPEGRVYLLLSSHNEAAAKEARSRYRCTLLRQKRLFFEEIVVYELRGKGTSHNV